MNALEKMRQHAREEEERKNNKSKTKTKSASPYFPMGDIPDNTTSIFRFLPDGNVDNPYFWVERQVCKLIFDGQVGGEYPTDESVEVTVPCMDMFVDPKRKGGSLCPIIQGTRHLWKDENDKPAIELARQYYKKRSYLYQGFVVSTDVEEEELPENPIRLFTIYPSIQKIIRSVLTDTEIDDLPTDYLLGRDFRLKKDKTPSDKWADYSGSKWSSKVRPLSEEENIAVQAYPLTDLSTLLGTQPDEQGISVIKAMFDDSFAGKPFDFDSYGSYYRAYKVRGNERRADPEAISAVSTGSTTKVEKVVSKKEEDVSEQVAEKSAKTSSADPADILAQLRNKHKKASS